MCCRNSENKSSKFTSSYNNSTTHASSIVKPDDANYPQDKFSVSTLVDKTSHKISSRYYYAIQIESCSSDIASVDRHDFCGQVLLKSEGRLHELTCDPLNVTFVESREQVNNVNVSCNAEHYNETTRMSTTISSEGNYRLTKENVNFLSSRKDIMKNCIDVNTKNDNNNNNRENCTKKITSQIVSSYAESTSSKLFVGERDYKGIKLKHDAVTAEEEDMFAKEYVSSHPAAKVSKCIQVICGSTKDLEHCTRDCATMLERIKLCFLTETAATMNVRVITMTHATDHLTR